MKISFLNLGCRLKLFYKWLSFLCLLLLIIGGWYDLNAKERVLRLVDALKLGLNNSLAIQQISEDEKTIRLKREKTNESKIKHAITFSTSSARNEIGDSRDLDSSASDTNQYNLSYKQTYESGFSVKSSIKKRISTAIEGDSDDEDFSKLLLIGDLPIFGKVSDYSRLVNEKTELTLNSEQEILNRKRIKHQNSIAEAYFVFLSTNLQLQDSNKTLDLIQQSIALKKKTLTQVTELEIRELQFQLLQAQQNHLLLVNNFQQSMKKLAYLVGDADGTFIPENEPFPDLQEDLYSLKKHYLGLSDELYQLEQNLAVKQKELNIKDLDLEPDISVGGFAGKSQTLTEEGVNYGVYLSLQYQFWGGQEKGFNAVQSEIESIRIAIKQKEHELILQAEKDYQQMLANKEIIKIRNHQKQLAEDQISLAEAQFKIGRIIQSDVLPFKIKAVSANTQLIKSRQTHWEQMLKILKRINGDLLVYLDSKS